MKSLTTDGIHLILLIFILNVMFVSVCTSYKILIIPLLGKSHVFSMTAMGEELGRRGHLVHMMLAHDFPLTPDLASNQSRIDVIRYGLQSTPNTVNYDAEDEKRAMMSLESKFDLWKMKEYFANKTRRREEIMILDGNEQLYDEMENFHYDIAIVDSLLIAKYVHLIPHRLGIPTIAYSHIINPWLVPVPWLPSFAVGTITEFIGTMTFLERLQNTIIVILLNGITFKPDPPEEILDKYRRYGHFDSLDELISRSVLYLLASDPILDEPLPSTPNIIQAGGLTIKPTKSKPLPKEFEDFIEIAKTGVIVVSFGSMAPSLPRKIAEKFLDAFSRLPDIHFIWRFINKDNLDLPKNVMTAKWLPQNDLLTDPRVKLFITHCGNNGQFEAVYHGVPMIGFPLFGDQPHNGKRMEHKGYGIAMNIHDFTTDGLLDSIHQIISDEKYKKRVTLASEIFKSARRGPAERVGDAVEHVIRFAGDHLRPAGSDLALYQYLMLDILALLLIVIILFVFVIWKIVFLLVRKFVQFFKKQDKRKAE